MDVEFHPKPRTQTRPKQKAATADRDLESIFSPLLHLLSDSWGLSHQLTAMQLNHMVVGPEQSLIFCFMHFQANPQKAAFLGLYLGMQEISGNINEGVICITKLGHLVFSLVRFTGDMRTEERSYRAEPQTSSSRSEIWNGQ